MKFALRYTFFSTRMTYRSHVAFGILFNIVSFLALRRMRHLLTPQILHEGAESNERQARHNKALTTFAFIPKLGMSYLLITGMMVGFSKSKGDIFMNHRY